MRRGTPSEALSHCPNLETLILSQTDCSDILSSLPHSLVYLKLDDIFDDGDGMSQSYGAPQYLLEFRLDDARWMPSSDEWVRKLSDRGWCPKLKVISPWKGGGAWVESSKSVDGEELAMLCRERGIQIV
jgi:hypothetical protein